MDFTEPLESSEDLENYFVELDNIELRSEIFEKKRSENGLKSLFGRKFLILGDYKVGKSSLKNYISYILNKSLKTIHIDVNVADIKGLKNTEEIKSIIFKNWYRKLANNLNIEKKKYQNSDEYLEAILKIYDDIFENQKYDYDYSIVVLDQANKLEKMEEVNPFKQFCEVFQGIWEQDFSYSHRKKILIICCGERKWIDYFQLTNSSSFGVFSHWILYGENWEVSTLREALSKRIKHALKPDFEFMTSIIISDKLANKLYEKEGLSIRNWIKSFDKYLNEFGEQFADYNNDFMNFDKFLDKTYDLQVKISREIKNYKLIGFFEDLLKIRRKKGYNTFKELINFLDYIIETRKGNSVSKTNLRGILKASFPILTYEFIVDELCLGMNGEKPEGLRYPLFKLTPDNIEILIVDNFYEFLKSIKRNYNKKPSEFILKYIDNQYRPITHHISTRELEMLDNISDLFGSLEIMAKNFNNDSINQIFKNTRLLCINKLKKIWKDYLSENDPLKQNLFLIDLKTEMVTLPSVIVYSTVKLYLTDLLPKDNSFLNLPIEEKIFLEIFKCLINRIKKPAKNIIYDFWLITDPKKPSGVKELINKTIIFIQNIYECLKEFNNLTNEQQFSIIKSISFPIKRLIDENCLNKLPSQKYNKISFEKKVLEDFLKIPKNYRNTEITETNIREFLNQISIFESNVEKAETIRECMILILKRINDSGYYYTNSEIQRLISKSIDNLYFPIGNVYISHLDNDKTVKSGSNMYYVIKKIKESRKSLFNYVNKPSIIKELRILVNNLKEKKTPVNIIFIDDIIGSGEQFISKFLKFRNELLTAIGENLNLKFYLIAAICSDVAIKKIDKQTEIGIDQIKFSVLIKNQDKAFHKDHWIDQKKIKQFKSFLKRLDNIDWVGRKNSQYLIITENNTPNNTISCLWKEVLDKRVNKIWKPLFPRTGQ